MKNQKQIWSFPLILIGFVLFLNSSCKKDDSSGNPIQNNATVQDALSAAGFTTYDGNTPPTLEGTYTTTPMKQTNATKNLNWLVGQYMNSKFKLYGMTSSGEISFQEWTQNGQWGIGKGGYITGSGQNFTIWVFNSLANGAETAFVVSGTLDLATGNLLNCNSFTVYTKASSSYVVGDWFKASGWIQSLNSIYGNWKRQDRVFSGNGVYLGFYDWYLVFNINNTYSYYAIKEDGYTLPTAFGTFKTSGNSITIYETANMYNNYTPISTAGTFKVNSATQLVFNNLYIFSVASWARN